MKDEKTGLVERSSPACPDHGTDWMDRGDMAGDLMCMAVIARDPLTRGTAMYCGWSEPQKEAQKYRCRECGFTGLVTSLVVGRCDDCGSRHIGLAKESPLVGQDQGAERKGLREV